MDKICIHMDQDPAELSQRVSSCAVHLRVVFPPAGIQLHNTYPTLWTVNSRQAVGSIKLPCPIKHGVIVRDDRIELRQDVLPDNLAQGVEDGLMKFYVRIDLRCVPSWTKFGQFKTRDGERANGPTPKCRIAMVCQRF
jgi:hypothetical protein